MKKTAKFIEAMNNIILHMNNEDAIDRWFCIVPDGANADDFDFIANEPELLKDTVNCFRNLMQTYAEDGFYVDEKLL
jgi:hypothetical protein